MTKTVHQLNAASSLQVTDELEIQQSPFGLGSSKKITAQQILDLINSEAQLNTLSQVTGLVTVLADKLNKAGDTLTGYLIANADPIDPLGVATKQFAESLVVGLLDDRGNYNASSNVWPSSGGSGTAGAILKGDLWTVSVAGTLGGVAVSVGNWFRALVDNPGQTASNWSVVNANIGYVPENINNKSTSTSLGTSDQLYPTQNAVYTYVNNIAATKANAGANTDITSLLLNNTGLKIKDIGGSFNLNLKPNSTLSANRILNLITGDSDRSITLNGNPTLDDWFDAGVKTSDVHTAIGWNLTPSGPSVNNSTKVERAVNLVTSNSTPTNIVSLPLDSGDSIFLEGAILGSGGSNVVGGKFRIAVRYPIGGSLITANNRYVDVESSNSSITFDVSANDSNKTVNVVVTGSGGMTWNCDYSYKKISPAG